MYATFVWLAMSGIGGGAIEEVHWQTDYAAALKQATSRQKPLAVFVGSGAGGWERLSRDGGLKEELKLILAENYVCLYADTTTEKGRWLAQAFRLPGGLGIVISDRTGSLQAFRHEGDLPNRDLTTYLQRYADPNRVTRNTDTNPTARTSYYAPGDGTPPARPAAPSSSGGVCYR